MTLGAALVAAPAFAAPGGKMGDADANGVLTRAEAQAHATQKFARMDANKDGKIDATDRAARHAEMQAKRFVALDANKDGSVSKAEWDQHGADRAAKRADRKEKRVAAGEAGDGKRDGMRGHHGKRGGHGMRGGWMKADANGDKAITQAEFETAALARFDRLDANKDGQVTAEERQAQREAWKAKSAEWRAKRGAAATPPAGE
nr:hypothetical protein [Sphingopyxis panaciterrae]